MGIPKFFQASKAKSLKTCVAGYFFYNRNHKAPRELYIIIDRQEEIMPKNGREDEPGSQGLSALVNNKKALKVIGEGGGGRLCPIVRWVMEFLICIYKISLILLIK